MTDRRDIEESLKSFHHQPGGRVKRSVMSAYARAASARVEGGHSRGFWIRPVPLYAAAAVLVLMVAVAFAAGRYTSPAASPAVTPAATAVSPASADGAVTSHDIEWSTATNDLL